jgi:uncharacterized protein with PIN domain
VAVVVLDASATIAYLRGEPGKERVAAALLDDDTVCRMHAINVCEVFYDTLRASGETSAENVLADLANVGIQTATDMDDSFLKVVGRLKVTHRLSLGDCFALALKRKSNAEFFTADHHEFDAIVASGESGIVFIR